MVGARASAAATGVLLCAVLLLAVAPGHMGRVSLAQDWVGQHTEMLKIFRVQVSGLGGSGSVCCLPMG
jgi:hypothetical protein